MINTIEEFIEAFTAIKQMGWIRTHRSGNTGIGKTLEDLLDIQENNYQEPDFGEYELKHLVPTQTACSLFSQNHRFQRVPTQD